MSIIEQAFTANPAFLINRKIKKNKMKITAQKIIDNVLYPNMVQLWNEYNEHSGYMDDNIHPIDDEYINLYFTSASDAIKAVHYGNFDFSEKYFKFDGYGNLESLSDSDLDDLDWSDIADWLNENTHIAERYGFEIEEDEEE